MGFLAITNAYTMRICLNVAITEMVVKHNDNGTLEDGYCPIGNVTEEGGSNGGDFEWSEPLQGLILSSFFWGYVITHIPGGMLAEKFGGKWALSLGILSTAIFTLLTPLVSFKRYQNFIFSIEIIYNNNKKMIIFNKKYEFCYMYKMI